MNNFYKLLTLAIGMLLIGATSVAAQESEEPNRLSIGVLGGVTKGHMNIGTEFDPTFGFNLRYAANPTFAIQTNFLFGKMTTADDDDNFFDRSFENSYFTTSLSTHVNFLRLLGSESERVSWYGNVGVGLIFNDVTTAMGAPLNDDTRNFRGEDHTETELVTTFGTGLRFNLGHRIDLFAQYDYNLPNSDIIDGHRTHRETPIDLHRRNNDNWSTVTAGIQIKFGSSSKDADWHYVPRGVDPAEFRRLAERVESVDGRVADNTSMIAEQGERLEDYNNALNERMDELERQLNELSQRLDEMDRVDLTFESDVLFNLGSSVILDRAKPDLAKIVRALNQHPDRQITVVGHTCDLGTEEFNQGLSERRAASVKRFMVEAGIEEGRIQTDGRGLHEPLVPNESETMRQLNRRVEMTIE